MRRRDPLKPTVLAALVWLIAAAPASAACSGRSSAGGEAGRVSGFATGD